MLTYDDCLGMCGLRQAEIDAIARHEHLPEILALELGAQLSLTTAGRAVIRRMILDGIEAARQRDDAGEAAALQTVLAGFALPADLGPVAETPERRLRALGLDAAAAAAVETRLLRMLREFGLDEAHLRSRFQLELQAAETRCACCKVAVRCARFQAGSGDAGQPEEFCVNAPLFGDLQAACGHERGSSASAARGTPD